MMDWGEVARSLAFMGGLAVIIIIAMFGAILIAKWIKL